MNRNIIASLIRTANDLDVLGFNKKQSEKVISMILKENPEASVENLIKLALKNL